MSNEKIIAGEENSSIDKTKNPLSENIHYLGIDPNKLLSEECHLLNSLRNAKNSAFNIQSSSSSLVVNIDTDKLVSEDLFLIKELFSYFLKDQHTISLKVCITQPNDICLMKPAVEVEVNQSAFSKENAQFDKLTSLIANYAILINSVLFVGFLSSLHENGLPIEVPKWEDALYGGINKFHDIRNTSLINHFISNIDYLYTLSKDTSTLEKLLPKLLMLSIESNKVAVLLPWIEKSDYLNVIRRMDGHPNFFLHKAIITKNESWEILLKLMSKPSYFYNKKGNSLLHVCDNPKYFEQAYKLTPNINHRNKKGNTALHEAADQDDLEKAYFLLMNKADTNIENKRGKTFWTLEANSLPLSLYRRYRQSGNVLKLPSKILKQKGLTCGLYAVAFTANHHRTWKPGLFSKEILPARKRDCTPKAKSSLRQFSKREGITDIGEVLSAQKLVKVIEETGCSGLVCDINDYQQFIDLIKKTIDQNFPIIIPFSWDDNAGKLAQSPKAEGAHWAPVIGWSCKAGRAGILLAQWGTYYSVDASELFKAFYNSEEKPVFPKTHLFKKKGGDWDWSKDNKPMEATEDIKTYIIPLTDLKDFWGKLIIVLPPKYDVSLLNTDKITLKQ